MLVVILSLTSPTSCTWRSGGRFRVSLPSPVIRASAHLPAGVLASFENEVLQGTPSNCQSKSLFFPSKEVSVGDIREQALVCIVTA